MQQEKHPVPQQGLVNMRPRQKSRYISSSSDPSTLLLFIAPAQHQTAGCSLVPQSMMDVNKAHTHTHSRVCLAQPPAGPQME
jgi:hypothetical protein